MPASAPCPYRIRRVHPDEFARLGLLIVDVYASLPGMPSVSEQPQYYKLLLDVGKRQANPAITVFAAVGAAGELLGSVDFIADMAQYGSGGSAGSIADGAGIRLLAVAPESRGRGLGRVLTQHCIDQARNLGKGRVILHSTRAMQTAWGMYERMGFVRFPELDFQQGQLEVFGFCLELKVN